MLLLENKSYCNGVYEKRTYVKCLTPYLLNCQNQSSITNNNIVRKQIGLQGCATVHVCVCGNACAHMPIHKICMCLFKVLIK